MYKVSIPPQNVQKLFTPSPLSQYMWFAYKKRTLLHNPPLNLVATDTLRYKKLKPPPNKEES